MENNEYILFSRAFQRHIVYSSSNLGRKKVDHQCDTVTGSYLFLDEAIANHPSARIETLNDIGCEEEDLDPTSVIAGMGCTPSISILREESTQKSSSNSETLEYLAKLVVGGTKNHSPLSKDVERMKLSIQNRLEQSISTHRLRSHTPKSLQKNYDRVIDLLTRGRSRSKTNASSSRPVMDSLILELTKSGLALSEMEARSVISAFPQLCLYDFYELENRVKFLLAPFSATFSSLGVQGGNPLKHIEPDYYQLMRDGFGVGLTMDQATKLVKNVPQFLSLYHEDSKKASIIHFYKDYDIPSAAIEKVRSALAVELNGVAYVDIISLGMLHSFGASVDQIRLLLYAFPILIFPDQEPGWELLESDSTRSELNVNAIIYLRKRLQIGNSEVYAMMKTHPRLTSYGVSHNIMPTLNALQTRLGLSTRQLRHIILRMPSLIGISVDNNTKESSLDKHINFFLQEARMSKESIVVSVLKQPSILQYSVESNLRPKLRFLLDELYIRESAIERVIQSAPTLFGLSLEENLRPTIQLLRERCSLTDEQLSVIFETVPSIILLSLKRKIDPCLKFLFNELKLTSSEELGSIIHNNPRVLTHSIDRSLRPKIEMIREALKDHEIPSATDNISIELACRRIFTNNPALLTTTNELLRKRLKKAQEKGYSSLSEALAPKGTGRKRIFLPQAKESSADRPVQRDKENASESDATNINFHSLNLYENTSHVSIGAFTTGAIFPMEKLDSARGYRKAGSIAIYLPQIKNSKNVTLYDRLNNAMKMSFGMIMPEESGGSCVQNGTVLAGFPFVKASKNRCGLYAAHGALKVILQLLKQAATDKDMSNVDVDILIYTDSTYAWKALKDTKSLLNIAEESIDTNLVINTQIGHNSDLVIPIAKTIHRMVSNNVVNRRGERLTIGRHIEIKFRHTGDVLYDNFSGESFESLQSAAKKTAVWQFEKG